MAEVRDVIKALKGEGRTIFMSSHLLGEVQEVCDDVALLNHGELLIHGSVRELSRGADTSTFQTTFLRSPTPQELEALASVPGSSRSRPRATRRSTCGSPAAKKGKRASS